MWEVCKMDKIGIRVKTIRKKHKDTLKSLANKIDYDWSNLSKIERGVYTASTEILEKIAKVYDIDISYFFYGDEELANFKQTEKELIFDRDLSLENLKKEYNLNIDGKPATDEEIEEMIKYIRHYRFIKQNESS
jgi:transcriptional regulator with XRE-family HTH domain